MARLRSIRNNILNAVAGKPSATAYGGPVWTGRAWSFEPGSKVWTSRRKTTFRRKAVAVAIHAVRTPGNVNRQVTANFRKVLRGEDRLNIVLGSRMLGQAVPPGTLEQMRHPKYPTLMPRTATGNALRATRSAISSASTRVGRNLGSFAKRKGNWKKGAGGRFVGSGG
jgi:hypothetical protein